MNQQTIQEETWDMEIKPKASLFEFNFKEVWRYRDLMLLFVKRDFASQYKQTILGPLWFFIQPLLTTLMFVVVFGNIAQISTDGLPKILFYLAGITIWNYFSEVLNSTSGTFVANAAIFGKVYFPRLVMPLSKVISGLIKFGIQFLMFLVIMLFFHLRGTELHTDWLTLLWLTPVLLFIMAGFGFGFGLILSALTTKYRDLSFLVGFGVQLLMYATPVIYPLSSLSVQYRGWAQLNPLAPVVEAFRKIYLGTGMLSYEGLGYSLLFVIAINLVGILIFNRVEKTFMDTV